MSRKLFVYAGLGIFLTAGIAATRPAGPEKPHWKNLKVLPKDIGDEDMDALMENLGRNIGVTCLHCHVKTKPGIVPERIDFPSDENPNKKIARDMMRMTTRINKKFFHFVATPGWMVYVKSTITCRTCHRGLPVPNYFKLYNRNVIR